MHYIAEPTLKIYEIHSYQVTAHANDILSFQKNCFRWICEKWGNQLPTVLQVSCHNKSEGDT